MPYTPPATASCWRRWPPPAPRTWTARRGGRRRLAGLGGAGADRARARARGLRGADRLAPGRARRARAPRGRKPLAQAPAEVARRPRSCTTSPPRPSACRQPRCQERRSRPQLDPPGAARRRWPRSCPRTSRRAGDLEAGAGAGGRLRVHRQAGPGGAVGGLGAVRPGRALGLPARLVSCLDRRRPAGRRGARDPPARRQVAFTGSRRVAEQIAASASPRLKALSLELGGHGPLVVLPDADLDVAAEVAVAQGYVNAGQACYAVNRVLVPPALAGDLLERMRARIAGVDLGPMATERGLTRHRVLLETPAVRARASRAARRSARRVAPALVTGAGPGVRLVRRGALHADRGRDRGRRHRRRDRRGPLRPTTASSAMSPAPTCARRSRPPRRSRAGRSWSTAGAWSCPMRLRGWGGSASAPSWAARLEAFLRWQHLRVLALTWRPRCRGAVHATQRPLLELGAARRPCRVAEPPTRGGRPGKSRPRPPARARRAPPGDDRLAGPEDGRPEPVADVVGERQRVDRIVGDDQAAQRREALLAPERDVSARPRSTTVGVEWAPRSPSRRPDLAAARSASASAARAGAGRALGERRTSVVGSSASPTRSAATAAASRGEGLPGGALDDDPLGRACTAAGVPGSRRSRPPRRRVQVGARQDDQRVVAQPSAM